MFPVFEFFAADFCSLFFLYFTRFYFIFFIFCISLILNESRFQILYFVGLTSLPLAFFLPFALTFAIGSLSLSTLPAESSDSNGSHSVVTNYFRCHIRPVSASWKGSSIRVRSDYRIAYSGVACYAELITCAVAVHPFFLMDVSNRTAL